MHFLAIGLADQCLKHTRDPNSNSIRQHDLEGEGKSQADHLDIIAIHACISNVDLVLHLVHAKNKKIWNRNTEDALGKSPVILQQNFFTLDSHKTVDFVVNLFLPLLVPIDIFDTLNTIDPCVLDALADIVKMECVILGLNRTQRLLVNIKY